jgi:parallel beta-helix repeat protein
LITANTGTYGVYPVQSTNVLVERVTAFGVNDAGIYAGQCENVIVRNSVAYDNVIGIELENTAGGEVYGNYVYDNATGIFIVILPNLTSKTSHGTLVYDNRVEDNNGDNFAPEGAIAGLLPSGVGILILGSDDNEIYENSVTGNRSVGLSVFSLTSTGAFDELDVGPNPEGNWAYDNEYDNNGYDPDAFIRSLGIPTGDILYDVSGPGNVFDEPDAAGSFPPLLPGKGWPEPFQRVYFRLFNALIGAVS